MKRTGMIARGRMAMMAAATVSTLTLLFSLGGCGGGNRPRATTIKGSDTMVILGQKWAEVYMQTHPGKVLQVTGGGSGTGIAALINGTTTICQSSRSMKNEERQQIQTKFGEAPEEYAVAKDGVTVYVHNENPITALTVDQIRGIYTGAITNWSQVGGTDRPIVVYSRENNSGTYVFFKEHILGGADFMPGAQTLPGTSAVADAVSKDPGGIGYGGYAYGGGIKHVSVAADSASAPVEPNEANVKSGLYPLARNLFWYTRGGPPAPETKELIDWVLSDAGQEVVKGVGYFPVR